MLRSTDRTMIFCRRSYMSPEATVKMWMHSGSSSAVRFAPAAAPEAELFPSQEDILPHIPPAHGKLQSWH